MVLHYFSIFVHKNPVSFLQSQIESLLALAAMFLKVEIRSELREMPLILLPLQEV